MIMRDAVITPFIQGEENNTGKFTAVIGISSIICTCYSMEFVTIETALSLFFCSGLFALVFDILFSKANYKS